MVKNIVFDTNIWLNFVEKLELDYLEVLSNKVLNKELTILLPENIQIEFDKKISKVRASTIKEGVYSVDEINATIESISKLFENSKKLRTIDTGLNDWVISGKAPNHNKNNYEDTVILNTLLSLPAKTTFHFIANDDDYRLEKKSNNLHSDIIEKFENKLLNVIYYKDYPRFFGENNLTTKPIEQTSHELYNWRVFKLEVSGKDTLSQLSSAIKYYYKELSFIPLSYLSNAFPFNNGSQENTYFDGTSLNINNQSLFDFFDKALVQSKSKKSKINKTFFKSQNEIDGFKEVIKTLNKNLVYNVKYNRKSINIEIEHESLQIDKCDCYECSLNRCEIENIKIKCEADKSKEPKKLIEKAFYYYKTKQYYEALSITEEIIKLVNKKDYPIIHFIAEYNKNILRGIWLDGDDKFKIERKKLKPTNENKILKNGITSIIGYFKYSKYFDYKYFDLIEDFEKVKERYNANNGYGNSYVSNIDWKNVLRWSEFIQTFQDNGLFFDVYSNVTRFAKYTFKLSLYASEDKGIQHKLNDYVLRTTLPYLKITDIKEVLNELKIDRLNYNSKNNKKLFQLFVDKIDSINQSEKFGFNHSYLRSHITEIEKIILIQSHLSFSKQQDNIIISKIITLIKSNDLFQEKLTPSLKHLINNKISSFNKKNAIQYIKLILKQELSINSLINGVFELLEANNNLYLSQKEFNLLIQDDIEDKTGYYRGYIYLRLYELGNKTQKVLVLNKVYKILENNTKFDHKLYDFFTTERIIKTEEKYLTKYLNCTKDNFKNREDYHYSNPNDKEIKNIEVLNYFISHVYYFYNNRVNSLLKEFENHSDYYDFLINPKSFENSEINLHWFYLASRNSYLAIKSIINENKEIDVFFAKSILKTNNIKYSEAYLGIKSRV